jgi:hypothetical protein
MIDPYDPEGFRAAGHAVIDQLADYLAGTGRSAGPVLDYAPPREDGGSMAWRYATSTVRLATIQRQSTVGVGHDHGAAPNS